MASAMTALAPIESRSKASRALGGSHACQRRRATLDGGKRDGAGERGAGAVGRRTAPRRYRYQPCDPEKPSWVIGWESDPAFFSLGRLCGPTPHSRPTALPQRSIARGNSYARDRSLAN